MHCCKQTTLERKEEPKIRCTCCNKNLNDYEATRKHALTGAYLDMCNLCFSEVSTMADLPVSTREDLASCVDIDEQGVDIFLEEAYNDLYREDNIKD